MTSSLSEATIRVRGIAGSYPWAERTVSVGGRAWTMTAVSDPDILLERVETEADLDVFPYGLLLWPSAVALAERLAAEPSLVADKRVLELGAGVGLPGLVAQSLGAVVTQTDYQEEVLALTRRNAQQNGLAGMEYLLADWRSFPTLPHFEVVLGSDVLYERSLHLALLALLSGVLAPGGLLLVSDPLRPQAAEFVDRMERQGWLLEMESCRIDWRGETEEIALFRAMR